MPTIFRLPGSILAPVQMMKDVDAAFAAVDARLAAGGAGGIGPAGPPGPQGVPGPPGPQGPVGPVGPQGPPGGDGGGSVGPAGPQGPQGEVGPVGAVGPAGPQGDQGPQGTQGPQGPAGADGAQGPAGVAGAQGPAGAQGEQGLAGPAGAQGLPGLPGPQGPPGADGAIGPAGADGAQGPIGPAGPAGTQGVAGPAGPQGEIGPQGASGDTVTIIGSFSVKTITELPPSGYIPADWDSPGNPPLGNQLANGQGLLYAPTQEVCLWVGPTMTPAGWVTLGSVAGPMGPQGIQGPEGPQGAQGTPGPQGPAGPQGTHGDPGPAGAQGLAGADGTPGVPGVQGPQGVQGEPGATGAQGAQGAQGLQGVQGIQGTPGPTAVSADAGNTATLGTDSLIFVPTLPPASNATPLMNGAAAVGVATAWARGDHVHPVDTSRMSRAGTVAADNAGAGNVGELLSTSITVGVTMVSGTAKDVGMLALTPGDWDVSGQVIFNPGTNLTVIAAAISLTTNTLPTAAQLAGGTGAMQQIRATFAGSAAEFLQTGVTRVNVSASTNVYLVALVTGTGSWTTTGFLRARRMR